MSDDTTAHLVDGRVINVPLAWSWRLSEATPTQRAHCELIGDGHGIHWPDIDEDLSAAGMLNDVAGPSFRKGEAAKVSASCQGATADERPDGRPLLDDRRAR